MDILPPDYVQYLDRHLKQNVGKQVYLYGKPLGILSNSEIHYFTGGIVPLIIYLHMVDGSIRRLTHKELLHVTYARNPAIRFFTTTGNIFKVPGSQTNPVYSVPSSKEKPTTMKLVSIASRISGSNDPSNPTVNIELILAVVTLILQNCPMNKKDIVARAQSPGLLDRVRLRRTLVAAGASPDQVRNIAGNFFTVIGQETEADLLSALDELQV